MAGVARDLLLPSDQGGMGAESGSVTFVRYTAVAAAEPWLPPPEPTRVELDVRAQVFGVGKELVGTPVPNGGQIVSTDLMVIAERVDYEPGDVIELDGTAATILSVRRVPEVGVVSVVKFIVRA